LTKQPNNDSIWQEVNMLGRLILPFSASVLAVGVLLFVGRNPDAFDAGHGGFVILIPPVALNHEQWLLPCLYGQRCPEKDASASSSSIPGGCTRFCSLPRPLSAAWWQDATT